MILNVNGYLVRFLDERLTQLENQLDNVRRLAKQLGLVSHLTEPLLVSGRPTLRAQHVSRPTRVASLEGGCFDPSSRLFARCHVPCPAVFHAIQSTFCPFQPAKAHQ